MKAADQNNSFEHHQDRIATLEDLREVVALLVLQLHRVTFLLPHEDSEVQPAITTALNDFARGVEVFAGRVSLCQ